MAGRMKQIREMMQLSWIDRFGGWAFSTMKNLANRIKKHLWNPLNVFSDTWEKILPYTTHLFQGQKAATEKQSNFLAKFAAFLGTVCVVLLPTLLGVVAWAAWTALAALAITLFITSYAAIYGSILALGVTASPLLLCYSLWNAKNSYLEKIFYIAGIWAATYFLGPMLIGALATIPIIGPFLAAAVGVQLSLLTGQHTIMPFSSNPFLTAASNWVSDLPAFIVSHSEWIAGVIPSLLLPIQGLFTFAWSALYACFMIPVVGALTGNTLSVIGVSSDLDETHPPLTVVTPTSPRPTATTTAITHRKLDAAPSASTPTPPAHTPETNSGLGLGLIPMPSPKKKGPGPGPDPGPGLDPGPDPGPGRTGPTQA